MATRLEITHGLIAERDRLSTSADTLSVTRPTTGSKTRSKGVLFVLVGSTLPGPRARDATALVAETIRHEYYYDESAGVPVCLEKAIKSADRRLRSSREGAGLPPGSLGVAAAVVRNNELYLATIGAVEAYLVRTARLLMPERSAPAGLPADDARCRRRLARRAQRRRRLLHGVAQRDRDRRHRGAQECRADAAPAGRGGTPPPPLRGRRRRRFGRDHRRRGQREEASARRAPRRRPSVGDAYGDLPGVMPEPVGGAIGITLLGARGALDGLGRSYLGRHAAPAHRGPRGQLADVAR